MENKFLHLDPDSVELKHNEGKGEYEFYRRNLVPFRHAEQCVAAMYELPPGKSAYPYHYHVKNEEIFYIISGAGVVKTPGGERPVKAGDFLFFPANESGAHKITNTSSSEMLVYLDFDTINDLDVSFYPDSGKIGVWGKDINQLYKTDDQAEYYDGE